MMLIFCWLCISIYLS